MKLVVNGRSSKLRPGRRLQQVWFDVTRKLVCFHVVDGSWRFRHASAAIPLDTRDKFQVGLSTWRLIVAEIIVVKHSGVCSVVLLRA
jgi:hypothetical protein